LYGEVVFRACGSHHNKENKGHEQRRCAMPGNQAVTVHCSSKNSDPSGFMELKKSSLSFLSNAANGSSSRTKSSPYNFKKYFGQDLLSLSHG
jgi:hypothetical protein